jgi:TRAP-type C4-dicarboxylate transport system permease small subunit
VAWLFIIVYIIFSGFMWGKYMHKHGYNMRWIKGWIYYVNFPVTCTILGVISLVCLCKAKREEDYSLAGVELNPRPGFEERTGTDEF